MRAKILKTTALAACAAVGALAVTVAMGRPRGAEAPVSGRTRSAARPGQVESLGVNVGHQHDPVVQWRTVGTFDDLVRSSDLVIQGTVESRRPAWARQGWSRAAEWL